MSSWSKSAAKPARELLEQVPHRPASDAQIAAAEAVVERTASQMGRHLETDGIKELLQGNLNHPRWDDVAERCLTCGNCTMVCPTCFCTTIEDHSDLAGDSAERVRKLGFLLHAWIFRTSMAAACGRPHGHATGNG